MPRRLKIALLIPLLTFMATELPAQEPDSLRSAASVDDPAQGIAVADTTETDVPAAVTPATGSEMLPAANSTAAAPDSLQSKPKNLERPAFSTARDSIIEDLENRIIYYFGDVTATFGDLSLKSDYMAYNMDMNVIYARGVKDPVTDSIIGRPVMTERDKSYEMDEVYYNFTTRKAKIKNMATQQDEGKLVGDKLKMMPDASFNIAGGKYTVCDAEHPHYYMKMTAAKVTTKPKQKTMFGPAYLVVGDVPIPIGLPFGFVPEMPDRASGILIPTYGEETARGLYLKDFGYSFVIGDYVDIALTGDIFTYGSWAVKMTSRYKVKYKFDGNFTINYSKDIVGEKGSVNYQESSNFGVTWSHSMDSKARPGTSFRASVNFSSPSNNKYNSRGITEALQSQTSSSISYSKTWTGISLSVNALHSQNSRDSSYCFTFPNITLSVNRFYPFKRQNRVGKERFYEKISFSYNTAFQNKINFKASEFGKPGFWDKMQNGMNHNFQIGLPQFTLFNYLQFSPSVNYGMNWFFREQTKTWNEELQKVETSMGGLFSAFGITQTFSAGLSMNTRLYGTFNFGKKSKIQAIRHMITPSFSLSFAPELGTPMNGYTSLTYTNAKGETITEEYNKYSGQMNSVPGKGKTASLSFSFANNLEAKVNKASAADTASKVEKIKLIDQLNLAGSYNFLADSMKLSNISVSASTTVFGKLGINGNMNLDPYAVDGQGRRINKFNVIQTGHLARLTNASASLSWSINGGGQYKGNDGHSEGGGNEDYAFIYYHPITGEYIPGGWCYYMNPNVPWSLRFGYNYSYSRSYQYSNEQLITKNRHTQTLSVSGSLKLTKRLDISLNTGFDLTQMKMSTTQVSATFDLHCFGISFSWVPNGQWESWSFRIAAKASALADLLKLEKSSSYWDN